MTEAERLIRQALAMLQPAQADEVLGRLGWHRRSADLQTAAEQKQRAAIMEAWEGARDANREWFLGEVGEHELRDRLFPPAKPKPEQKIEPKATAR